MPVNIVINYSKKRNNKTSLQVSKPTKYLQFVEH